MQELSLKSGGGRNFGRGRNLGRVRYMYSVNVPSHNKLHTAMVSVFACSHQHSFSGSGTR